MKSASRQQVTETARSTALEPHEIIRLSAKAGSKARFQSSNINSELALKGSYRLSECFQNLLLHGGESEELQDAELSLERKASITLGVLLQGKLHFSLDETWHELDIDEEEQTALCFAINLLKPTLWKRKLYEGNQVKKVSVSYEHAWLQNRVLEQFQELDALRQLFCQHARVLTWPATAETRSLAQSFQFYNGTQKLLLEGLSMQLGARCLDDLARCQHPSLASIKTGKNPHINNNTLNLMKILEALALQSGIVQPQLDALAKEVGMSKASLQRNFKQTTGKGPLQYLRERRLQHARDALIDGQVKVGEAAWMAGYKHSSNFCAAFKKHFGIAPGEL
ncbi:helix-turn-helix transcriptional regulator [Agaribacterium haliotis]|uniref:helix-turn-helix transcriptional regulator n=1 Tax=Agaribacterium haliotis TaxID=2013869 RepID=UPI001304756D|nr:helix-turn-helix transcriptional regulator [Agaribacterium haliotis]